MKTVLKSNAGFSLLELLLVIGIFSILFSTSTVVFGNLVSQHSLRVEGEKTVQALREARTYAATQRLDSAWGIYLDTVSDPQTFTVFKGSSYAGRDANYDRLNAFPNAVSFGTLTLGSSEIVFAKRTGFSSVNGSFELISEGDIFTVFINPLGFIDYALPEL